MDRPGGTTRAPRETRRASKRRQTWRFRLWLANLALGTVIGMAWLSHAPAETGAAARIFGVLALVSTVGILSFVVHLGLWLSTLWLPAWPARAVHAVVWTAFQLALFADTRVYNLFRYHINGMVWSLLTAPDMDDSVQLSRSDMTLIAAGLAGLLLAELLAATWLARLDARRPDEAPPGPRLLRPGWVLGAFLLPVIVVEKGMYAWADLNRDLEITALQGLYPAYMGLTVKAFAETYLDVDLRDQPRVDLPARGLFLDYPKEPVAAPEEGPRPNILLLVVDSLRHDMLREETMPHLVRHAAGARVFTDHLSGGNATRFGLFSLLYGLPGPYWHPVYAEKRSPVLVDALLDAGYRMHVFSTASMYSPEFRSTAWVRIEDRVTDKIQGETKAEKDAVVGELLLEWVAAEERDDAAPFFAFVLLDSPHQTYSFPLDDPPFEPWVGKVDYLALSRSLDPEMIARLWNSYRNAVHHADSVVGRILSGLNDLGVLANTVVAVTGDHGEEFGENGFFGHTSNFTAEQIRVPLVLSGPGIAPGIEARPTSHADVPITLLERLGVSPSLRSSYGVGGSLLDPDPGALRVASGWDEMGMWIDGGILVVPTRLSRGFCRAYTRDWRIAPDEDDVLRSSTAAMAQLARDCRRFLR